MPKNPKLNDRSWLSLAFAGSLEAQKVIEFADKVDKNRAAYYAYAVLDGLSLSYSMFKYFCDVVITNQDFDAQHELMQTPTAMAAIAAESIAIIGFSFLACHFDGDKSNALKKFIAAAWPYARDVMKALKNSYKGLRSTLQIARLLGAQNMFSILIPAGLVLGALAAANRIWRRHMVAERKKKQKKNRQFLQEIEQLQNLTAEEWSTRLELIKPQSTAKRAAAFASAAFGGMADSMYLYAGLLTLTSLNSAVLWPMAILCVIYAVGCVITRVYEEHCYQQKLILTELDCEIALLRKRVETIIDACQANDSEALQDENKKDEFSNLSLSELDRLHDELEANLVNHELDSERLKELKKEQKLLQSVLLVKLFEELEKKRAELQKASGSSYKMAVLMGVRHGLYAYGALSSVMFVVATVLFLCSVTFPPVLLITAISAGAVLLMGFIAHALISTYRHNQQQKEKLKHSSEVSEIEELKEKIKREGGELPSKDECRNGFSKWFSKDPSPQFFFQEWFEVIRSFFSGLGKAQKSVDFTCNSLQEADAEGHYHDTPVMFAIMGASAIVFSLTLAIRALAKGFRRDKEEVQKSASPPPTGDGTCASTASTPKPSPSSPRFFTPASAEEKKISPATPLLKKSQSLPSFFNSGKPMPRNELTSKPGSTRCNHLLEYNSGFS